MLKSSRWPAGFLFLAFLSAQEMVRAGEKELPPTVRVQIRSLDTVIDNVKLLVSLAGREEIARQVEGLIKTKIGNKGLEGIDPARPFGAYSRLGKDLNDVSGVVLVPIADENAFLGLLENNNIKIDKNAATGIYTLKTDAPVSISFRFANKYAYFTALNLDALEMKNLLAPEKVFPGQQKAAISATLRLDQLPEALKLIARAQFEQGVQEAQDKKIPGETPTQKAFRMLVAREIVEQVSAILTEGEELNLDINVDKTSKEMSATFSLTAVGKSGLEQNIAKMGQAKSLFGHLRTKEAALQGSIALSLPQNVHRALDAVIEEEERKNLAGITDPAKRKQAEALMQALNPTLKGGVMDAAISFQGPDQDKHYSFIAALKVKEGNQLQKTLRDLLDDLLKQVPPQERAKINLDAETVAGTKIHRLDLGTVYNPQVREIFGASPVFVAIRDDALFYSIGPDGLAILKNALKAQDESAAPPFSFEVSLARLAPLMGKTVQQKEKVQALFPAGEEGTIRFTIEGGSQLQVRVSTRLSVVQFMGAIAKLKK